MCEGNTPNLAAGLGRREDSAPVHLSRVSLLFVGVPLTLTGAGDNEPAMASMGDEQATVPATPAPELKVGRTRTSGAWVAAVVTLLVGLLMLIFILQNGARQRIAFLWLHFTVPLGAGFLLAGVLGGLLVVLIGIARIGQIRLAARRHARAEHPGYNPRS